MPTPRLTTLAGKASHIEAGAGSCDDRNVRVNTIAHSDGGSYGLQPQGPAGKQLQKRRRVLLDVHQNVDLPPLPSGHSDKYTVQNVYESERMERIKRNQEVMKQLGLCHTAQELLEAAEAQAQGDDARAPRAVPKPRRPRVVVKGAVPSRRSARFHAGLKASSSISVDALVPQEATAKDANQVESNIGLMGLEEYFALVGKDLTAAIKVDGEYRGWVSQRVAETYGIPGDAQLAWEQGGGGKFSYKNDKSALPAALKVRGWSDAKAFAATQLRKNPNAYFYRHVAPDQQQSQGEWTEEEHEAFLNVVRQWGAGNKWGLFASHIPCRVGYQCSAYYREVIIPSGLVIDPRFKMQRSGKAVYVG